MKTWNLTQSSLRNDPINCRMHGFSFHVFEDKIEVEDVISPRSFVQILISSTPWTQKWVKNGKKSNGTQIVVSRQFDYLENSRAVFSIEEQVYFKRKLGVTIDLTDSSQSTVTMRRLLIESSRLSLEHLIDDEGLRWVHIFKWGVASHRSSVGSSFNNRDVLKSPPIAINLSRYNSWDGRSRWFHLNLIEARAWSLIEWTSRPPHQRALFIAISSDAPRHATRPKP